MMPIAPDSVSISFIGEEIEKAIENIRAKQKDLPEPARVRVEKAIVSLQQTQDILSCLCRFWMFTGEE